MRHRKSGKTLDRKSEARHALLRSLMLNLIVNGRIKTTHARARFIRPQIEKLVTVAKNKDVHSFRKLIQALGGTKKSELAAKKLCEHAQKNYATRPGGYTRITKLGTRVGDGASTSVIEFV